MVSTMLTSRLYSPLSLVKTGCRVHVDVIRTHLSSSMRMSSVQCLHKHVSTKMDFHHGLQLSSTKLTHEPYRLVHMCNVRFGRKQDRQLDLSMREAAATIASNDRVNVKVMKRDGSHIGVMSKGKALNMAKRQNLKLCCVNERSSPPVYKLMSGIEMYEETMRKRREKVAMKVAPEKVLKLSSKIGEHDLVIKFKHIQDLLDKGHPVRLISKTPSNVESEDEVANKQAELFLKLQNEFSGSGQISEASRKTTEFIVMIKPSAQNTDEDAAGDT